MAWLEGQPVIRDAISSLKWRLDEEFTVDLGIGFQVLEGARQCGHFVLYASHLTLRNSLIDSEIHRRPKFGSVPLFFTFDNDGFWAVGDSRCLDARFHQDLNQLELSAWPRFTDIVDGLVSSAFLTFEERERISSTSLARRAGFAGEVAAAYEYRCAMCEIGLGLTESAHIVPVAVRSSVDDVTNGIHLCVLHHSAFDADIIRIDEKFGVRFNVTKIAEFESTKKYSGMAFLKSMTSDRLRLPSRRQDWPDTRFIAWRNHLLDRRYAVDVHEAGPDPVV